MPISFRAASRLTGLAAAAALVGGALTHSTAAQASSPIQGSISDTATSVSWGGGPFVTPNPSAQVSGLPDCTVPQSCDDFTLHISTPAGYGDTHSSGRENFRRILDAYRRTSKIDPKRAAEELRRDAEAALNDPACGQPGALPAVSGVRPAAASSRA